MKRNYVSMTGIAYHDSGSGPVVLLIHAFGCDADMWDPQVGFLTGAGYRVLAPDHRGFGQSSPPDPDFRFDHVVADMVDVLDSAGVQTAVAAGVSMGSATSVALAIAHPSRVAGLVLADNSRPDGVERGETAAARIRELGMKRLADVYEPILFGETYRRSEPGYLSAWRERLLTCDPAHLATIVAPYHSRPDPAPHLPNIGVPTAIVFGEEDAAIPESRRSDYSAIPGAAEFRIQQAGHMSNVEQPDEFNAILLEVAQRAFQSTASHDRERTGEAPT